MNAGLEKTRGQNYDLSRLLRGIDSGYIGLPDFQRDYDWTTRDVISLLATVLSGWPVGSLLLMKGSTQAIFSTRAFEEAPHLSKDMDLDFIVLDGQQRLTALYHSLYGRGSFRYALRLEDLRVDGTIDSLEDALVAITVDDWERYYSTPQEQLERLVIPVTALREAADFFDWRDAATSEDFAYTKRLTDLYRNLLSGMHKYEVPAVVIDPSVPPAAIARIFERVNRLGMPLGTFDLVVAKSFTSDFNLRREWEAARVSFPRLDAFFGDDGLDILSVISLRVREDVRQSAVLDMPGSAVRDGWHRAVAAMDEAVQVAASLFGAWSPDYLPYPNLIIVLAAVSYEGGPTALKSDVVRDWYWSTVFSQRYAAGSNTRAVADHRQLLKGEQPAKDGLLLREELLESNKKQYGTLHRAVISLLASQQPRDLLSGDRLDAGDLERGVLPDVRTSSLFPRAATSGRDDRAPVHLRTMGMVLSDVATARRIPGASFSDLNDRAAKSQYARVDYPDDVDPEVVFNDRLVRLAVEIEGRCSGGVRVVSRKDII